MVIEKKKGMIGGKKRGEKGGEIGFENVIIVERDGN